MIDKQEPSHLELVIDRHFCAPTCGIRELGQYMLLSDKYGPFSSETKQFLDTAPQNVDVTGILVDGGRVVRRIASGASIDIVDVNRFERALPLINASLTEYIIPYVAYLLELQKLFGKKE